MNFKLRILLPAVALLISICQGTAQTRFQKTFGGASSDVGSFVQTTEDGGYIIGGGTGSFGAGGVYLLKLDSIGDTAWTRTYGGNNVENLYQIEETSEGGYVMTGLTNSFGVSGTDVYVMKLNSNGDTVWTRTYGGTGNDGGNSIQQTDDGGYIVLGGTNTYGAGNYDFYVIRINPSGDTLWTRTYGGSDIESGFFIQETTSGGYILVGGSNTFGAGDGDVYVIKIDDSGDTLWTRSYGGTSGDGGICILGNGSGRFTVLAGTSSFGNAGVYVFQIDDIGDTLWTKVYSDSAGLISKAMAGCADGGYIITGTIAGIGSNQWDVFLLRIDSIGDTLWSMQYDNDIWDEAYSVQQTPDGGFILTGFTGGFTQSSREVYLIKTDANGNTGCGNEKRMSLTIGSTNTIVSSTNTVVGSGGIPRNTGTIVNSTNTTASTLCFDTIIGINEGNMIVDEGLSLRVFPNPLADYAVIETYLPDDYSHGDLIIMDIMGVTHKVMDIQRGYNIITLLKDDLPNFGIYFCVLIANNRILERSKVAVIK